MTEGEVDSFFFIILFCFLLFLMLFSFFVFILFSFSSFAKFPIFGAPNFQRFVVGSLRVFPSIFGCLFVDEILAQL